MPDDSSLLLAASQKVSPLSLRELSQQDARTRGRLCGRGLALNDLTLGFCGTPLPDPEAPWLSFSVNGSPCYFQANWGQLRRFVGIPLEGLEASDIALVLEDKASDQLEEFERKTGLSVRVTGVGTESSFGDVSLGVKLQDTAFALALSDEAITALSQAIPRKKNTLPDDLPMALRVELGELLLGAGDLRGLQKGDAFAWGEDPEKVRVLAQDTHCAKAAWVEDGLELFGGFQRISQGEELGMTSEIDAPQADSLDDLDVRISVRAGEALMTLGDLKKLGSGSILPLGRAEGDLVDLVVNGRRIGIGQLVSVGGDRCVEIKDLFGDG